MKGSLIFSILLGLVVFLSPVIVIQGPRGNVPMLYGTAYAEQDWKTEFEDICGKTQDAMVFSPEELRKLIERCDKIKPLIEKLGETERKVYLRRLEMCRELFVFTLESKEKK